ncbi:MAG: AsnC family transcriptional regulator [Dehalococcoidia bacterium]
MTVELDRIDRRLLNLMQSDFPLVREPFAELGKNLNLGAPEVLERVKRLQHEHIIRIIGPVFNSRNLGYRSTLVAMRIPEEGIERAAQMINRNPGVGHNYERGHFYNLWFTLAARGESALAEALGELREQISPEDMVDLPAVKLFKIRLFFDLEGKGNHRGSEAPRELTTVVLPSLSASERAIINELQRQLPLVERPFDGIAQNAGMDVEDFLAGCRSLKERGLMRRFGASIEQRHAGFTAGALVCWAVPEEKVDEAGMTMAGFPEVTHCYERRTCPRWPRYNMFTMVHGDSPEHIEGIISRMAAETSITEYEVLPTVREFKKERLKYEV